MRYLFLLIPIFTIVPCYYGDNHETLDSTAVNESTKQNINTTINIQIQNESKVTVADQQESEHILSQKLLKEESGETTKSSNVAKANISYRLPLKSKFRITTGNQSLAQILLGPNLNGFNMTQYHESKRLRKYIVGRTCRCPESLICVCCVSLAFFDKTDVTNVCLEVRAIPTELTLKGSILINNVTLYSGQLDPSFAPICLPPFPSACIVINHIDISNLRLCTKLSLIVITLWKFPCLTLQNGILIMEPNEYF